MIEAMSYQVYMYNNDIEKCFKYMVLKYFHSLFKILNTVIQVVGI